MTVSGRLPNGEPFSAVDRGLGFRVVAHLDEAEAAGTAAELVDDDLAAGDGPVGREQLDEVVAGGVVREVPDVNVLGHDRRCPPCALPAANRPRPHRCGPPRPSSPRRGLETGDSIQAREADGRDRWGDPRPDAPRQGQNGRGVGLDSRKKFNNPAQWRINKPRPRRRGFDTTPPRPRRSRLSQPRIPQPRSSSTLGRSRAKSRPLGQASRAAWRSAPFQLRSSSLRAA